MTESISLRETTAIISADYGRDAGWLVESAAGETLAELVDCEFADMFWDSYRVLPIDPVTVTPEFWYPDCHAVRNRRFSKCTVDTFGSFDPDSQRVTLRSLYINVTLGPLDCLFEILWRFRQKRRVGTIAQDRLYG